MNGTRSASRRTGPNNTNRSRPDAISQRGEQDAGHLLEREAIVRLERRMARILRAPARPAAVAVERASTIGCAMVPADAAVDEDVLGTAHASLAGDVDELLVSSGSPGPPSSHRRFIVLDTGFILWSIT
jgi:hypothetical protein